MTLQMALLLSAIAFVGTHFLLSHPLREPLVGVVGEGPFSGIYSLVALVTFGLMVWFYSRIGREPPLWVPGDAIWLVASLLMWLASILLIGSFIRNPAFPGAPGPKGGPTGVFVITRHPMMWSFALWAVVHMAVVAMPIIQSCSNHGTILNKALIENMSGTSTAQSSASTAHVNHHQKPPSLKRPPMRTRLLRAAEMTLFHLG